MGRLFIIFIYFALLLSGGVRAEEAAGKVPEKHPEDEISAGLKAAQKPADPIQAPGCCEVVGGEGPKRPKKREANRSPAVIGSPIVVAPEPKEDGRKPATLGDPEYDGSVPPPPLPKPKKTSKPKRPVARD